MIGKSFMAGVSLGVATCRKPTPPRALRQAGRLTARDSMQCLGSAKPGRVAMQRVLITGAAGDIGGRLRGTLKGVYPMLRLSDVRPLAAAGAGEEVDQTDLTDMVAVERMCEGVDGIVHLGGNSTEASWEVIRDANITGTYNLFEAARRQGVQRIVFATSNHAVGYYRRDQVIDHQVVVRPDSRYGLSKAFGEALESDSKLYV
ncbi:MAG: NAD(P)-dependent oxidoreductase [Alphaproteobacteria bacterium]|nr:NAD(P)-dependent oxidoreductase [Alphaproteobacteria bacterium]